MSCNPPRIPGTFGTECGSFPLRGLPRPSTCGTCIPNPVAVGNDALSGNYACDIGDPVAWSVAADVHFAPTKEEANVLAQASAEYLAAGQCAVE